MDKRLTQKVKSLALDFGACMQGSAIVENFSVLMNRKAFLVD